MRTRMSFSAFASTKRAAFGCGPLVQAGAIVTQSEALSNGKRPLRKDFFAFLIPGRHDQEGIEGPFFQTADDEPGEATAK